MKPKPVSVRITHATNERLKAVLDDSKLSKDQFVDYVICDALDQIQGVAEPGILPHIQTMRRELKMPLLVVKTETLAERMISMQTNQRVTNSANSGGTKEEPRRRKSNQTKE